MTAARIVECSAGVQAVVGQHVMALAWPMGDGTWAVQHRGDLHPVRVEDREVAEARLESMFANANANQT